MVKWTGRRDLATWLEFHDSTLAAVNYTATDVEVVLDAYVHRWETKGDSWLGSGLMQPVRILIGNVGGRPALPALPLDIADGRLRVGRISHENHRSAPVQRL